MLFIQAVNKHLFRSKGLCIQRISNLGNMCGHTETSLSKIVNGAALLGLPLNVCFEIL